MSDQTVSQRQAWIAVLVAALGYFVDAYDLLLFSIVRKSSLTELGVPPEEILDTGVRLLNMQMGGMLVGGVLWGICGDRKGRLSVLFGSILMYSVANILNAFVHSVEVYGLLRFLAGLGLAGELGAGVTLVSELLDKEKRGLGTTIVASVGVAGVVVAALVGDYFHWRTSYLVGGVMGLLLLILRISVRESNMFESIANSDVKRADLRLLFGNRERALRYCCCVMMGIPIWYSIGILVTFAPELGKAQGMTAIPTAREAVLYSYIGLVIGDLASGLLSQYLRSRKKVVLIFLTGTFICCFSMLQARGLTPQQLYLACLPLGFFVGYWAVFVSSAAEQFGTNLRSTVTTTVPNFVRGAVVPMTQCFSLLTPSLGIVQSASVVGAVCFLIALIALAGLKETFGRDLDFLES